ncbi:hypothetical protein TWF225_006173 [Orbilia oligospora]|uniref:Uncharacterized protein n=1 Tax=Orbilia oligospora TaxID=2813651 RepID=A0A8H2E0F4_ORBOL|nr:hypothetical protein TWF225_006173 [Orbilia oligospora]TGJ67194.1 hypothetical protein EYR41_008766 [Orbilia oligospora]
MHSVSPLRGGAPALILIEDRALLASDKLTTPHELQPLSKTVMKLFLPLMQNIAFSFCFVGICQFAREVLNERCTNRVADNFGRCLKSRKLRDKNLRHISERLPNESFIGKNIRAARQKYE